MLRYISGLLCLALLPTSAIANPVVQNELQRFASPTLAVCTSAPQEVRTMAHELVSGQKNTAGTLEQVKRFVDALPAIDSNDATDAYVSNVDALAIVKIAACLCVLENIYTIQPDNAEVTSLMERTAYYLLFWRRSIAEELIIKAAAMEWAPNFQENKTYIDAATSVARGIAEGATRGYALLALKLIPASLGDPRFLNRLSTYFGWSGSYKGQAEVSSLINTKTPSPENCAAAVRAAYRALDKATADASRSDCKKKHGETGDQQKEFDSFARLQKTASEKAGKSDPDAQATYACAAYDLGRTAEAIRLLNELYTAGNRDRNLIHRLALSLISQSEFVKAIDVVAALPQEQWTKETSNALAGAAAQLLLTDVFRAAGQGGAGGALLLLQGQANWFTNVLQAVGSQDAGLASKLHALYQASLDGLLAKERPWAVAGTTLRQLLDESRKKFGTDTSWANVAALAALMDNSAAHSKALLRTGIGQLRKTQRLYVDVLCLMVALDYIGLGDISADVRKLVQEFDAIGEPAYFMGTALWLLGRKSGDLNKMSEGFKLVVSSMPALKDPRTRLMAMNNLGVMEASVGKFPEALAMLGEASKLPADLDDRMMVQINLAALEARSNGPSDKVVQFLMSVVSTEASANWLRAAAGRMLLALNAVDAGLKTIALQESIAEAENQLKQRGMYVPDQQAVIVAEPNISFSAYANFDAEVTTDVLVSLRPQMVLWLAPIAR